MRLNFRHSCGRLSWGAAGAIIALAACACTDPGANFNDFVSRVPDARRPVDAPFLTSIPDVSGRFFLAVASVVDVDQPLYFISENTMTAKPDGTAVIDVHITPLNFATLQPVTGGTPLGDTGLPVSIAGHFEYTQNMITIASEANPFSSSDLVADPLTFSATIRSADFYCGDVSGMLTSPLSLSLDGSTFGAVRVPDGAIGDQLPDPVSACGPEFTPDAGVPDAHISDAMTPDAQISDAMTPDAPPADAMIPDAGVSDAAPTP